MRRKLAVAAAVMALAVSGMALAVSRTGTTDSTENADAIVMLGARVLANGKPSDALEHRAEKAAELFLRGRAPLVLFSGGSSGGSLPSEAALARDIAVKLGVPESACVLEAGSHSTVQNAELSAPLLKARGVKSVLVVSDQFHLLRASALFRRQGFVVHTVASERKMASSDKLYSTLREVAALARRPWLWFS